MVGTMAVLINLSNAAAAARIKELQAAAGILGVSLLGFSTGRHRRPCLDVPADRNVDGAWDAGGPGCARPWSTPKPEVPLYERLHPEKQGAVGRRGKRVAKRDAGLGPSRGRRCARGRRPGSKGVATPTADPGSGGRIRHGRRRRVAPDRLAVTPATFPTNTSGAGINSATAPAPPAHK
jgi:hypothetical protein